MQIKAPNPYRHLNLTSPKIFLSGSIAMGKAEYWQEEVAADLQDFIVLNPRRDDWDSSWQQSIKDLRFYEQVHWELEAMEAADLILVYFSPGTAAPITLLELGLFHTKPMLVCCPHGFYRKGNVDIVCERYGIRQVDSLQELSKEAKGYFSRHVIP